MSLAGIAGSLSGMRAAILRQTISANNVANLSTPAFKAARAVQTDLAGPGTVVASTQTDFSQGFLESATNAFDLAVEGEGFIPVSTGRGPRYTRAGVFGLDGQGFLVTPGGDRPVAPIQVPAGAIGFEVARDGTVTALLADGARQAAGQLPLVRFANPEGLIQEGRGLYAAGANAGTPQTGQAGAAGFGAFVSRALEASNVDLAAETAGQILSLRTFQFNAKALQAQDETLGALLDITR